MNTCLQKRFPWKKFLIVAGILAVLVVVGDFLVIAHYALLSHQHCMKQTTLCLRMYAEDHNGRFPFHTNGFGDALLLLVRSNKSQDIGFITGPDDQGETFKAALETGADIPESKCSRVYIQGLSTTNNPMIALIFDRRSTPGGDHFRGPFKDRLREVGLLDGSMQIVSDPRWPQFSRQQIELLVKEGISREDAETYYNMATNLAVTVAADRAFPAAVAELGR